MIVVVVVVIVIVVLKKELIQIRMIAPRQVNDKYLTLIIISLVRIYRGNRKLSNCLES